MAKSNTRESATGSASDGAEAALAALIGGFSARRAEDWLRAKFPSFDSSLAEPLDCAATKSEREHFSEARLWGFVGRMPEGGAAEKSGTAANRPLVVAAVRMRRELTERTSRLVQFNYAKKVLRAAIEKGSFGFSGIPAQGLFFFYDRNGCFRLSLVTAEVERRKLKWNAAKRQSFYVEPDAANNIVKRRLLPPIRTFADLREAFSVEQLTKEFYRKLFDWYSWTMEPATNVHFPNDIADRTDDRKYNNEAVIRLVTRLMFTWFIRQRKLVPDVLFDREGAAGLLRSFDPDSMEQDNYYRAILQNLFFATFNCQPEKRRFIHVFQGKSSERHVTTLYRYEKEFRGGDGAAFMEVMRKVPFLNCALFDCLDRREREEDGGRELYFDGFSGEKGRSAHLPNGLFFDEERGIVSLFNRYEFTVNENDADDSDVALDPELLGKVFENLLGAFNPETKETARKATGSFYTPREIVDYMVEESLKGHLRGRLAGAPDLEAKLDDLFDRNKAAEGAATLFPKKEKEALLDALYDCRVLDPACGSGAFPMGVLHCMVRLLSRLDPQNIAIRERLLRRYREEKTGLGEENALAELEARLREGQHFPDYERKLYLIENCIYGVDIQPIATQISKLRFFISLLCDQLRTSFDPSAENFGLLSLPNLEAKFVCANTLVALPEVGRLDAGIGDIAELRQALQENRHKIFGARSTAAKEKYKARDLAIRDAIRKEVRDALSKPDEAEIARWRERISDAQRRREAVAEPDWEQIEQPAQMNLFGETISQPMLVKRDRNAARRSAIDAEIDWAERRIEMEESKGDRAHLDVATRYADLVAGWDPYDQNKSESWFDPEWMFNVSGGFDVVIGNPPYVQLQANGGELAKFYEGENYKTFVKSADLYCLFTERGYQLLADDGIETYIMPNKWMLVDYGKPLRKFLSSARLLQILNFGDVQFFDNATNYVVVLSVQKNCPGETVLALSLNRKSFDGNFVDAIKRNASQCPSGKFGEGTWTILPVEHSRILAKMEQGGRPLKEYAVEIDYGIKTGFNEAYYIDDQTRTHIIAKDHKAATIIKPLLRGRDIEPYFSPDSGVWLLNVHNGIKEKKVPPIRISDYPAVRKHLDRFYAKLAARGDKGDTPYNLRNCAYLDSFAEPKIIYPNMTTRFPFMFDANGLLTNQKCFILTSKLGVEFLKYLTGLFNSKLAKLWMWYNLPELNGGAREISKVYFENIPVADVQDAATSRIAALVEQILAAKARDGNADTSSLEAEIDQLVYKLYGLTDEEIAIVEGNGRPDAETQRKDSPHPASPRKRGKPASEEPMEDEVLE